MEKIVSGCSGYSAVLNEETEDFVEHWKKKSDGSEKEPYEFKYQSSAILKGLPIVGILDAYSGGGYVCPIVPPVRNVKNKVIRKIRNFKKTNWIDKSTRALIMEFTVYNTQVNLYAYVNIIAEFQPGGGIIPYHTISIMRLERYHTDFGLFVLICEVVFFVFIVYFTIVEIKQIVTEKREYFRQLANYIDFSLILIAYFAIGLFIQREILTAKILELLVETEGRGYIRLQHVATVDQVMGYMISFLVFLANLKFLHLLRFNKRLGILSTTLKECASDLSSFAVCLLIVFLAFVQLFHLVLGVNMMNYATFISSLESTFSMMLGKFRYSEIQMTSPLLGPVIFIIFGLATSLILINILLTIVISTFNEVKNDMSKMPNDYEMVEFIVNRVRMLMGMRKKQAKVAPVNVKDNKSDKVDIKNFHVSIEKLAKMVDKDSSFGLKFDEHDKMQSRKRHGPEVLENDDSRPGSSSYQGI